MARLNILDPPPPHPTPASTGANSGYKLRERTGKNYATQNGRKRRARAPLADVSNTFQPSARMPVIDQQASTSNLDENAGVQISMAPTKGPPPDLLSTTDADIVRQSPMEPLYQHHHIVTYNHTAELDHLLTQEDLEDIETSTSFDATLEMARNAIVKRSEVIEATNAQLSSDILWIVTYCQKNAAASQEDKEKFQRWREDLEKNLGADRVLYLLSMSEKSLKRIHDGFREIKANWQIDFDHIMATPRQPKKLSRDLVDSMVELSRHCDLKSGRLYLTKAAEVRCAQLPTRGVKRCQQLQLKDVKDALEMRSGENKHPRHSKKAKRAHSNDDAVVQVLGAQSVLPFDGPDIASKDFAKEMTENPLPQQEPQTATSGPHGGVPDAFAGSKPSSQAGTQGSCYNPPLPEQESIADQRATKKKPEMSIQPRQPASVDHQTKSTRLKQPGGPSPSFSSEIMVQGLIEDVDVACDTHVGNVHDDVDQDEWKTELPPNNTRLSDGPSVEIGRHAPPRQDDSSNLTGSPEERLLSLDTLISTPKRQRFLNGCSSLGFVTTSPAHSPVSDEPAPKSQMSGSQYHPEQMELPISTALQMGVDTRSFALAKLKPGKMLDGETINILLSKILALDPSACHYDPLHYDVHQPRPALTRLKRHRSATKIYLPLHHKNDTHWTLALLDTEAHKVYWVDSLSSPDRTSVTQQGLLHTLSHSPDFTAPDGSAWEFKQSDMQQQDDFTSCGIFVLVSALHWVLGRNPPSFVDHRLYRKLFGLLISGLDTKVNGKAKSTTRSPSADPLVVSALDADGIPSQKVIKQAVDRQHQSKSKMHAAQHNYDYLTDLVSLFRETASKSEDRIKTTTDHRRLLETGPSANLAAAIASYNLLPSQHRKTKVLDGFAETQTSISRELTGLKSLGEFLSSCHDGWVRGTECIEQELCQMQKKAKVRKKQYLKSKTKVDKLRKTLFDSLALCGEQEGSDETMSSLGDVDESSEEEEEEKGEKEEDEDGDGDDEA